MVTVVQGFYPPFSYGGNYPYDDLRDQPAIVFSVTNGSMLYNNSNMSVDFSTAIGYPQGLQTLMTALTSVSYRASWQGNQTTSLYNATIDTPANLTYVPAGQREFAYNFTNIPLGEQQLEVDVTGGGIVWGGSTYYTFYTNASSTIYFNVEAQPAAKEPFPVLSITVIAIVALVVLVAIGLWLCKRHRITIRSTNLDKH
jgi:hypothetical protein